MCSWGPPPFWLLPHLPPSCLSAKGTLARKSKNLTPSGIFPQCPGSPGCKIASLVALARQCGSAFAAGPFRGFARRALCIMNALARAFFRVTLARSDRVVKPEYATRTDLGASRRRSRLGRAPRRDRALGDRGGRRDGERRPDAAAGRRDELAGVRRHGPARRASPPHRKSTSVGDDRDGSRRESSLRHLQRGPRAALLASAAALACTDRLRH